MTKILKRPLSILLAVLMIAGIFAALPLTVHAIYVQQGLEHFIPVLDNVGNLAYYDASILVNDDLPGRQRTVRLLFSTLTREQITAMPGWSTISSANTYNNCYLASDTDTPPNGSQINVSDVGIDTQDITYNAPSPAGVHVNNFEFSAVPLDPNTSYYTYFIVRSAMRDATSDYTVYRMLGDSLGTLTPMKINYNKQKTDGTYDTTIVNTHYISGQYLDVSELGTLPTGYCINTSLSTSSGNWNGTSEINIYYDKALTVTWKNGDTILETDTHVAKGTTPEYHGAKPEKETADGTAYYPFLGWSPEVETATADTTYTAVFSDTAVPYHIHDGIVFKDWTNTDSLPKDAGNYCLTSDVTTSATWTVPAGEMNLCLNGHKIDANGGNYAVITIGNGCTLNLYDPEGGGVITGANHTSNGGGVAISNGGHFNMYGGSIEGNCSRNGGGAYVNGSSATFHMYGGSIQYNEGNVYTGGILLEANTTFTMSGGSIQHNAGKQFGGFGTNQATMIFDGDVNISDNYIYSGGTSGKIAKSGDTYTLDTTGGTPCNVKTANANDRIRVTDQLTLTHKIGIIRQGTKGVFTTGYTTSGNTADPREYFYSDNPNYTVGLSNGEAAIVDQCTVTWNNWNGDELEKDTRAAIGSTPTYHGATPTKAADTDYYYTFAGWDVTPAAITGNTTYTATFTATPKPAEPHNGTNITVADTISENFYLDGNYYGADAYVTVNYNHNSNLSQTANFNTDDPQKLSEMDKVSGGAYAGNSIISVIQAPAQSTEPITINVYASQADAEAKTNPVDTITYSVYKYCREIIEGTYEDDIKDLARATLDYAAAAQNYFEYNQGNMATKDNASNAYYGDVADFDMASVTASASAPACIQSFSVVVKSDLEINLLSRTPINVESASIDTTDTSRFAAESTTNGDWYVVHISGIEPANMDNTFTVVTDKGNIVMSANAIMKMMAKSSDEKMVTLAKAMYLYGAAADTYFANQNA